MNIKTGIDIVEIARFGQVLKESGPLFLQKVFHEEELTRDDPVYLAGTFAAKEAVMKALSLPMGSWHDIRIIRHKDGSPIVELLSFKEELESSSLSISHDGEYAIAQFVAILK